MSTRQVMKPNSGMTYRTPYPFTFAILRDYVRWVTALTTLNRNKSSL
jgi:hypothetical protein